MKKKVFIAMAYFMVAMVAMQLLFNGDSKKSSAAHSESGVISYTNGIRVVVESGTNKISPCYCISRQAGVSAGDNVTSNYDLDAEKSLLINTAMLLGFNIKGEDLQSIQSLDKSGYSVTQNVIWDVIEGQFTIAGYDATYNVSNNQQATDQNQTTQNPIVQPRENIIPTQNPTTTQNTTLTKEGLKKKVYCQVTEPSYVNGEENLLKWNKETKQFELTLTNTKTIDGMSANATVKADETTLPEGVKVVAEGETLKITSTSEYLDTKTIKIYKRPEAKGKVVAWKNGESKQPQVSLDYDEDPVAKVMELKIKTEAKPVEVKPVATQKPEEVKPQTPEVKQDETVKVEEKNVTEKNSKEVLDESPKTGDSFSLALVYKVLIAVAFATIASIVTNVILNKRREIK